MTQIPSKRIEKLGKNLNAIVLFELMDISTFNKSKTTLARNLKHAINSISTNGKSESIKLDGTFFTENKIKVNIYARYNYGEYIELIFICDTSAALQKEYLENSESYVLKRNFEYEKMHREIESHIPPIMRGLHFNNELMAINKPFKLPALYIYNANIYLAHIQERKDKDLLSLCRALYNRIKPLCDVSTNYVFSYIGNLTGGSAHMLRPFQEENLISEKLFVDVQSISKSSERITLFLLDDFVGSGSTFVEWFQSNLSKKTNNNIEKTYYCVLTAFEKGIKHIKEQTNIQVICPQVYDKSSMVIDGDVFNSDEKQKIKSLLTKYSKRLPNQYLYGYDNCQLLVAFETNIPNNSISLLWASEYWSPLFKRK